MLPEDAYNISDLYIQLMDKCTTVDEIFQLHTEMFLDYTRRMAELKKEQIYSKPVLRCIDYIHQHLHKAITLNSMADYVNLSPSYLSAIFKKERNTTLSEYVRKCPGLSAPI